MLNKLKTLLGISGTDKDALLLLLIDQCTDEYLALTHKDDYKPNEESLMLRMAAHRYSLLGSEGLTSENFAGASFDYANDYPADLYRLICTHRKVRTL